MVLWLWSREGRELSSQRFSCQDWSGELGESCHGQTELDVWVSWEAFWWLGAVVVGMKESELIFGMKGWKIWDCGKIDRVWKNVLDLPAAFSEQVTDLSCILVSNWPWARMAACTHSLFCLWCWGEQRQYWPQISDASFYKVWCCVMRSKISWQAKKICRLVQELPKIFDQPWDVSCQAV